MRFILDLSCIQIVGHIVDAMLPHARPGVSWEAPHRLMDLFVNNDAHDELASTAPHLRSALD